MAWFQIPVWPSETARTRGHALVGSEEQQDWTLFGVAGHAVPEFGAQFWHGVKDDRMDALAHGAPWL